MPENLGKSFFCPMDKKKDLPLNIKWCIEKVLVCAEYFIKTFTRILKCMFFVSRNYLDCLGYFGYLLHFMPKLCSKRSPFTDPPYFKLFLEVNAFHLNKGDTNVSLQLGTTLDADTVTTNDPKR